MADYSAINSAFSSANGSDNYKGIIEASMKASSGATRTERGTKIVNGTESFDQNSFLKLLVAQMTNLDPTQDQDSTAYVTQMAQFAAMEQMYNLNETMSTFAYQSLIGKGVTVDVADSNGNAYTGIVRGVSKESSGTYFAIEVNENGKNEIKVVNANKLISVLDATDSITNSSMLLNSDFLAASSLADKNQKVVIYETDSNGKVNYVKGTVKGAYIDKGEVKLRVETINDDGSKGDTKIYSYAQVYKAGDLTEEDMKVDSSVTDKDVAENATNSSGQEVEKEEELENNQGVQVQQVQEYKTGNSETDDLNKTIEKESKVLKSIMG